MNHPIRLALPLLGLLAASAAQATCYTVYNRSNEVVYFSSTPPVDMRYQLHETVPAVFPGGHMVFGSGGDCPIGNGAPSQVTALLGTSTSPARIAATRGDRMITERRTGPGGRAPRADRN